MFFFRPAPVYEYVRSRTDASLIGPPLPEIDYQERIRRLTPENHSRTSNSALFCQEKICPFLPKKL